MLVARLGERILKVVFAITLVSELYAYSKLSRLEQIRVSGKQQPTRLHRRGVESRRQGTWANGHGAQPNNNQRSSNIQHLEQGLMQDNSCKTNRTRAGRSCSCRDSCRLALRPGAMQSARVQSECSCTGESSFQCLVRARILAWTTAVVAQTCTSIQSHDDTIELA